MRETGTRNDGDGTARSPLRRARRYGLTFIGLAPLMATADISTMMFVPLAISLAFGVLFATVITLLLVPALYLILEDFLEWTRALRMRPALQ